MSTLRAAPDRPATTLDSPASVRALAGALRRGWGRPARPVVVDLPGLPPEESRALGPRVDALLRECGCRSGELWLVVAGALLLALAAPGIPRVPFEGTAQLALCAGWLGAAALAGKAFGIARARSRAIALLYDAATRSDLATRAGGA